MKILLAHNSYQEPGGEDVVFRAEGHLLREAGHEVSEYRRDNGEIEGYSKVRRLALIGRPVWASDSYRDFHALLRRNRPEIVHVHNTFPLISPSIFWACRKEGVPVVNTLHNYRLLCPRGNLLRAGKPCEDCITGNYWQGVVHGCYRNSRVETAPVALMLTLHHASKTWTRMVDHYIAPSAFARNQFLKAGFPAGQITVKPNFVDPDPGQRTGDGSYALFIGRLSPEKGVDTLLRAWRKLPKTHTLRIVGDGSLRARLESEADGDGLSNVKFMGRLSHEQGIEVMKGARFVIFPSEWYETFGLGIAEAFACGVPAVVSRLGAMQEIVQEGHTGFLFQPGDSDDLARTVARAWNQPEHMRRLGAHARSEYETKYTAAVNYRQLLEIYEQVIARRAAVEEPLGIRTQAERLPQPDL
jgi:glycosyltransferase involved in cell wall biosynthesis